VLKRILREVLPAEFIKVIQQFRAFIQPSASPVGEVSDFHHAVIRPEILSRWRPRVLEIGVLNGGHTWMLLGATIRRFGTLVSIDPKPGNAIAIIMRLHPLGRIIEAISLEALAGLVDDKAVFDIANVDWLYGRRDLYYVPERIPADARHPYAKRGLIEGRSELAESGGFNDCVNNAEYDGGPKNGVLTAVEDFLAQGDGKWSFELLTDQFGLGILHRVSRFADPRIAKILPTGADRE
jgi:hypothetical protein